MSIESEWFEKGRNSILRQNRSGCCCKFNEEDTEIVSVCEAHKELINTKIAKLKAEKERLRELVKSKDELLVCYRIGKKPSEKLLDKLYRLEQALKEE